MVEKGCTTTWGAFTILIEGLAVEALEVLNELSSRGFAKRQSSGQFLRYSSYIDIEIDSVTRKANAALQQIMAKKYLNDNQTTSVSCNQNNGNGMVVDFEGELKENHELAKDKIQPEEVQRFEDHVPPYAIRAKVFVMIHLCADVLITIAARDATTRRMNAFNHNSDVDD
nr:hypothetical protein [Tanacetum cinerariifolium]